MSSEAIDTSKAEAEQIKAVIFFPTSTLLTDS